MVFDILAGASGKASQAAIAAAQAHRIQFNIQYASITLVYFDYILTFGREVDLIWKGKFQVSTVIYAFTRYPLLANVLYLFAVSDKLNHCDSWYKFISTLSILGRFSVIAMCGLRTAAVWDNNKYVMKGLVVIATLCIVSNCLYIPAVKCSATAPQSKALAILTDMLTVLAPLYELSASILIAIRVFFVLREKRTLKVPVSGALMEYLLQYGLLYFCGVFVFQLAAIILRFANAGGTFNRLINALTLPVSCILTGRFMLKLCELRTKSSTHTTNNGGGNSLRRGTSTSPSLAFAFSRQLEGARQAASLEFHEFTDLVVGSSSGVRRRSGGVLSEEVSVGVENWGRESELHDMINSDEGEREVEGFVKDTPSHAEP